MRRAGLLACILGALLPGPPAHAAAGPPGHAATTVVYRGLRITVPPGWPVYHLGPGSTECVRFDRHAVYLGPSGRDPLCPAHAVGRTEALHVEPLTGQTASFADDLLDVTGRRSRLAGMPALTARDTVTHEVHAAVPGAGVLVTGAYGTDPGELDHLLAAMTPAVSQVPRATPVPGASAERRSGERSDWVTGPGFDTCDAPSLKAMRAWREDFVAANIYIGGPARACSEGRLSRRWVAAVRAMGWRLIPTYVGPQAPCAPSHPHFTRASAAVDGQVSAADAVGRASALGLPPGTPIYMDLEAYDRHDAACRDAVLTFLDSWTRGVRALAYTSGVYSSVGSGIRDLAEADGIARPKAIWYAHWNHRGNVHADRLMASEWWPGHHRIKQYRGDHVEKHGGVRLKIDSDAVDGDVA